MTARIDKPMKLSGKRLKRIKSIESNIGLASDIKVYLNVLAWGRQKSGKTALIGSGPKPIILACENGTQTIRDFPDVQVFPQKDGKYITARWKHASDFLYYLRYADHDRETVGVDTTTALLRMAVRYINKDEEIRDEFRAKGTTDRRTWGRVGSLLNEFMEDLASVCTERGMHLIWTAQERSLNEEQSEIAGTDYVPDLTPAVRSTILAQPGIIVRTIIEEDMEAEVDETKLKYGMVFKHAEWPVGVRESILKDSKPFPAIAYNVTVPKLVRKLTTTNQGGKSGKAKTN